MRYGTIRLMNRTIIVVLIAAYKRISVSAEVAELKRLFACDGTINPVY